MKKFINEYDYNFEISKENINNWWNKKFKKQNVMILVILLITIILFVLLKKILFLISFFLLLIPIIFFIIKKNIAISLEKNRIKELYNKNTFKLKIEIDNDIKLTTPRGEKSFEFDIIESFYETKNLIVLNVQNSSTIALKKDSFIKETSKEFLIFINDILKNKCKEVEKYEKRK